MEPTYNELITAADFRAAGELYLQQHVFELGDLVQWKPGMRNARLPSYGEPAVVIDLLIGNRLPASTEGDNHRYEPCGMRLLVKTNDCLEGYWFDQNRFEPYKG